MSFKRVSAGANLPEEMNVIIEIPANSDPVKYEVDKETGTLFVDRFMTTCMHYPCNYGYIPQTLSQDGDPLDVLVIAPFPLMSGSVIRCRPIGMLDMQDEAGFDSKLIAVPVSDLTSLYDAIQTPEDLSPVLLHSIQHFFAHYKDLEPNRWVKIKGWLGSEAAKKEIEKSIERYHQSSL